MVLFFLVILAYMYSYDLTLNNLVMELSLKLFLLTVSNLTLNLFQQEFQKHLIYMCPSLSTSFIRILEFRHNISLKKYVYYLLNSNYIIIINVPVIQINKQLSKNFSDYNVLN